jgi:hypothetical protein
MLVKVFNNLWRTSTAKVAILWSVFSCLSILDFLSYKLFPDLRVRVRVYHPYPVNRNRGILTSLINV